jgi:hypothetical protein
MTVVLTDPAGFAVDWNWQRHLTVWSLSGRHYEPRFDAILFEHDLADSPGSPRKAHSAARTWWKAQGRSQAVAAVGDKAPADPPAH